MIFKILIFLIKHIVRYSFNDICCCGCPSSESGYVDCSGVVVSIWDSHVTISTSLSVRWVLCVITEVHTLLTITCYLTGTLMIQQLSTICIRCCDVFWFKLSQMYHMTLHNFQVYKPITFTLLCS